MNRVHSVAARLLRASFVMCLATGFAIAFATAGALAQTPPTPPRPPAESAGRDQLKPEAAPPLPAGMTGSDVADPRFKLAPGIYNAAAIAKGLRHISLLKKPDAFQLGSDDPSDPRVQKTLGQLGFSNTSMMPKTAQLLRAQLAFANSDLAFQGRHLFMGNFYGVNIYDISNPAKAQLVTSMVCPGGQGDVSVYRNLMFMSVEMPNGRIDCGAQGFPARSEAGGAPGEQLPAPQKERFRGVRIFDISDIRSPKQVAVVQTCRGSHTHTLIVDPKDKDNVYVYVSGTSFVRQSEELAGCSDQTPEKDPNTALFRIEVIRVPLAAPERAAIVSTPRVFMDPRSGVINALNSGATHGTGKPTDSDQCHDITAYSEIGLAAGACSGNGIVLDISDPVNPKRLDAVNDPNYAYWHSATFSNDGKKILFTDEWGGGLGARCRPNDPSKWGADAIFNLKDGKLSFAGYYKMPAAQGDSENCVAHNGSLIPVPGRDIEVQSWYQGGISVVDFTDAERPVEIAYFDRGPLDPKVLLLGGHWSAYWYNGHIYASEIARGLDILELTPSSQLSQNEIEAAKTVRVAELNVQNQQRITWPPRLVVAGAYLDQLERSKALPAAQIATLRQAIAATERTKHSAASLAKLRSLADSLKDGAGSMSAVDAQRLTALAEVLRNPVK